MGEGPGVCQGRRIEVREAAAVQMGALPGGGGVCERCLQCTLSTPGFSSQARGHVFSVFVFLRAATGRSDLSEGNDLHSGVSDAL